jgi:hypothetical protein
MGGKPNSGTSKDGRLKGNPSKPRKGSGKSSSK